MVDNTKFNPSTLGRHRKKYDTMRQLEGMTEKQVKATMSLDLRLLNKEAKTSFTIVEFEAMIEALKKAPSKGRREKDKEARDSIIVHTQDFLGIPNLAMLCYTGEVTLTPKQKAHCFDKLGEATSILCNEMVTSFAPIGAMSMFWAPQCQVKTANKGLAVYIGGWEDGSKNNRYQYAPRKCPISKRSGYRDDSFNVPVFEVKQKEVKHEANEPAKQENEEAEATGGDSQSQG